MDIGWSLIKAMEMYQTFKRLYQNLIGRQLTVEDVSKIAEEIVKVEINKEPPMTIEELKMITKLGDIYG